jgi:hypothetical protein
MERELICAEAFSLAFAKTYLSVKSSRQNTSRKEGSIQCPVFCMHSSRHHGMIDFSVVKGAGGEELGGGGIAQFRATTGREHN